ncbi:hypothetical protein [Pedobacter nyackensis]|uniref:hypothetical protein n=1 Tax=Pedobacter nyackensis TaxID=475255 RepID=UPI00292F31A8|nr:hypothetical protein [Pedobacter nyackensis]
MKICILLLAMFIHYGQSCATSLNLPVNNFEIKSKIDSTTSDTVILFFDPHKISLKDKSQIYLALGKLANRNNAVVDYKIKPNDNLNLIIKARFNVKDKVKHHLTEAILNIMADVNNLGLDYMIKAGDNFLIPKLPVQAVSKSTAEFTQYFDIYSNKTFLSSTISLATFTPTDPKDKRRIDFFDQAKFFAYKLSKDDLEEFVKLISDSLYHKLNNKAIATIQPSGIIDINDINSTTDSSNYNYKLVQIDQSIVDLLKSVSDTCFGKYYVFDYFPSKTGHGKKVLDVINTRFRQYGLDTNNRGIIPIPINYFQNFESSINLIERYYNISKSTYTNPAIEDLPGVSLIKFLKQFKREQYKDCEKCIPEGYLDVLFKYFYRLRPDIISSSFYITAQRDISPIYSRKTNTSLLTAVLNEPGEIESLLELEQGTKERIAPKQPLYSYINNYPTVPVITVGNRVSPGKFKGWHSRNGNRITVLGQGVGWGDSLTTIKPEEIGTSFATPDVATKLYIAKAFWRHSGMSMTAYESRIRLILSSDLDSLFIGKFASAGIVNMKKLLQISSGYLEDKNGQIIPIKFEPGIIEFNGVEKTALRRNGEKNGNPYNGICGITVIGSKFYAFSEETLCWRPIDIDSIKINLWINDKLIPIVDKNDFKNNFKQLVLLKNP